MAQILAQFNEIGNQFVQTYYRLFDSANTRLQVGPLYHNEALLTWEGDQFQSPNTIMEKLMALPFKNIGREITKIDCQPVLENNAVLISIVGQIKDADSEGDKPVGYSHTFSLRQEPNGFFIRNEIFRLSLYNFAA